MTGARQLREKLKGKSSELEQKDSELHFVWEQLKKAHRLAKGTQADRDHEKKCQVEKEDLLRDLEQVRAEASRKIVELKIKFERRSPCLNLWRMSKAT